MWSAPSLGVGLGLRAEHYSHLRTQPTRTEWLEATTENYLGIAGGAGGRPVRILQELRRNYPLVLHGVSLSIGSTDPLNFTYLRSVKTLMDRVQPQWVSDHFCWTGVSGENLHELLPLPLTRASVAHLVDRIDEAQNFLGIKMLFENVSSYLGFSHPEMTEWDFLSEVSKKSGCGILLDLNNVYVNSVNHGFDPSEYVQGIDPSCVGQFHLAGHRESGGILIDTHDRAIAEPVWDLYQTALRRFGPVSTLIERDAHMPAYVELEQEVLRAKNLQKEIRHEQTPKTTHPRTTPKMDEPGRHPSPGS